MIQIVRLLLFYKDGIDIKYPTDVNVQLNKRNQSHLNLY